MARTSATSTQQLETEDVRVTRWDFPPDTETGHHRHEYDYVVVPLTNGTLTIESGGSDGAEPTVATAGLEIGESYNRGAGVEHNVINNGDAPVAFVEIELLQRPG